MISKPLTMQNNLTYNIFTFDIPSDVITFYFTEIEKTGSRRIHKNLYPREVLNSLLNDIEDSFFFTTFTNQTKG